MGVVICTSLLTMAVSSISLILLTVCVYYATAGPATTYCEDEPKSEDVLECCKANRQTLIGHRNPIYQKCSKKNFNQRCCKTCSSHWKKDDVSCKWGDKAGWRTCADRAAAAGGKAAFCATDAAKTDCCWTCSPRNNMIKAQLPTVIPPRCNGGK